MSEAGGGTGITGIGTVMVPVSDQDRALAFYVEKLGFEIVSDTPYGDGARWVEVAPPGGGTTVALVEPRPQDPPPGGEANVAFATADADAAHAALRSRGIDVDEQVMRMGDPVPPMFWFSDVDANRFLIVERA